LRKMGSAAPNQDMTNVKMKSQASVPRDAFPPTPPGPEGSNGNGLLRVQWVSGAWLKNQLLALISSISSLFLTFWLWHLR
jgi:hypothetical protein